MAPMESCICVNSGNCLSVDILLQQNSSFIKLYLFHSEYRPIYYLARLKSLNSRVCFDVNNFLCVNILFRLHCFRNC